jgi:hypothetical protein
MLFLVFVSWWHLGHVPIAGQFATEHLLNYGGYVGAGLSWVLRVAVGTIGGHITLCALTVGGLIYLFDVPFPVIAGPIERFIGNSREVVSEAARQAAEDAKIRAEETRVRRKPNVRRGKPSRMRSVKPRSRTARARTTLKKHWKSKQLLRRPFSAAVLRNRRSKRPPIRMICRYHRAEPWIFWRGRSVPRPLIWGS